MAKASSIPLSASSISAFSFKKSERSNKYPASLYSGASAESKCMISGNVPSCAANFIFFEWASVSAATNSTLYFPSYSLLKASTILYVTDSCSFGFATWMPNLITVAPLASFVVEFALSPDFPPHPASNPNAIVVTKTVDPILFKFFFFISAPPIKIK